MQGDYINNPLGGPKACLIGRLPRRTRLTAYLGRLAYPFQLDGSLIYSLTLLYDAPPILYLMFVHSKEYILVTFHNQPIYIPPDEDAASKCLLH